ncbi:hypothetical protein BS47DRAFT_346846 [Hydnum rufescens UP504]|uniref:Uncharacterized protein n=1 Tax=Hydnum rufescens UP504 TaxID=1448309 RepID=A0A9P6AJX3_9AGAM|nr:hypothetical protein BS47DRAFT_346846 [Hydnum rufescens UP504]
MCSTTIALITFHSFDIHTLASDIFGPARSSVSWRCIPVIARILSDLTNFDVCVISTYYPCYQFTLYLLIRLARGGSTLGEAGIVAQGATALFMETVNITRFRIWPQTTPFVKTFRIPGSLPIFQLALIPGAILFGFLLAQGVSATSFSEWIPRWGIINCRRHNWDVDAVVSRGPQSTALSDFQKADHPGAGQD